MLTFAASTRSRVGVLLAVAMLAACANDAAEDDAASEPTIVQPGAPGEASAVLDPDDLPDLNTPHNEADVDFMHGMIHHHVQALRMTRLVPSRSASEDVQAFAERMDISQEGELEQMQDWLEGRDEDVPSLSADHDHGGGDALDDDELMPGMLTERELQELEAADGDDFDVLFLEFMIRHHEGAVQMVYDLFANGGGNESNIYQIAAHIEADQLIELDRMHTLLEERGLSHRR